MGRRIGIGQVGVFDALNSLIGWIGQQGTYYGAWFKQLYVGGNDPTNAPLTVDSSGYLNIVLAGSTDHAAISVRDSGNNQVVWMGKNSTNYGIWAKNFWAGGSGVSDAPFSADVNGRVTLTLGDAADKAFLSVNNASGQQILWAGKSGSDYGLWAKQAAIGGTGFSDANFKVDSGGNATITNATLSLTLNSVITSLNNTNNGTFVLGLKVSDPSPGYYTGICQSSFLGYYNNALKVQLGVAGGSGLLLIFDAAGTQSTSIYPGSIYIGGVEVINSSRQWVGAGVNTPTQGCLASAFDPYVGGTQYWGLTAEIPAGKTISVKGGAVVSYY